MYRNYIIVYKTQTFDCENGVGTNA